MAHDPHPPTLKQVIFKNPHFTFKELKGNYGCWALNLHETQSELNACMGSACNLSTREAKLSSQPVLHGEFQHTLCLRGRLSFNCACPVPQKQWSSLSLERNQSQLLMIKFKLLEENLNFGKILSSIPEAFLIKPARCEVLVSHIKCVKIFITNA